MANYLRSRGLEPPHPSTLPPSSAYQRKLIASLTLKAVTPILGGGARSGLPDPCDPIRTSAIRGQLRWWWRARSRKRWATPEDLRAEETAEWGGTDCPGRISVRLVVVKAPSSPKQIHEIESAQGVKYAWKVLDNATNPGAKPSATEGAEFSVEILGRPDPERDGAIAEALTLWATFGGLGMRTRRGFGAFQPVSGVCDWQTILRPLLKLEAQETKVATLAGARLYLGPPSQYPLQAWKEAVEVVRAFRKGEVPDAGRRDHHGPDSHSPWPQADAIRRIQETGHQAKRGLNASGSKMLHLPMVGFGAPITYNSASGRDTDGLAFNPVTITYKDGRIPSPVIARPVFQDSKWRAALLILNTPEPDRAKVQIPDCTSDRISLSAKSWPGSLYQGRKSWKPFLGKFQRIEQVFEQYVGEFLFPKGWTKL
jgi:CRISPR-associated protein Cmr1